MNFNVLSNWQAYKRDWCNLSYQSVVMDFTTQTSMLCRYLYLTHDYWMISVWLINYSRLTKAIIIFKTLYINNTYWKFVSEINYNILYFGYRSRLFVYISGRFYSQICMRHTNILILWGSNPFHWHDVPSFPEPTWIIHEMWHDVEVVVWINWHAILFRDLSAFINTYIPDYTKIGFCNWKQMMLWCICYF